MNRWGRDHWAVFLHVHNLCINSPDGKGYPDLRFIKCNPERHPDMLLDGISLASAGAHEPVRLNDGTELPYENYDGWDCMADLVREGLIENTGTAYSPCYVLTDLGIEVGAQIRQFRKASSDSGRSRVKSLDEFRFQRGLALTDEWDGRQS